jgi:hypothetical protein
MLRRTGTRQPLVLRLCWRSLDEDSVLVHVHAADGVCPVHGDIGCVDQYYAASWMARWRWWHLWRRQRAWRATDGSKP